MQRIPFLAVFAALACACGGGNDTLLDAGDAAGEEGLLDQAADAPSDFAEEEGESLPPGDPATCDEAAHRQTYVGCDFWPTVLPNFVGKHFDWAVVVSNAGETVATVSIERGGVEVATGEVRPFEARKFFLPWVDELKHWTGMCDTQPSTSAPSFISRRVAGGAYHLVSSVPVTVFQFNPIEYGPKGGPPGKDWSACTCMFGCHSYTNDASLVIPSTAASENYRVTAPSGQFSDDVKQPGYVSITGLYDMTGVRFKVGAAGQIVGGDDIRDAAAGEVIDFTIGRGEVVRIVGTPQTDLSGSVVKATAPVAVFSGAPCHYMPPEYGACDHLEESVFPAETLGARYLVTVPTNPRGVPIAHVVKIVGNVDGTALSYPAGAPAGAPTSIDAGEVADLGVVRADFEVASEQPFAVVTFQVGSSMGDPGHIADYRGDPAQSNVYAVDQFRTKYVFLAPNDYDFAFADVVLPAGATIWLDGAVIAQPTTPVGVGYAVMRIPLDLTGEEAHVLESDGYVGLQVMGYGFATSYQYPGGLNLTRISEPPLI